MRKLIIPRGAAPRRYRKLVASGEVKGQYREEPKTTEYVEIEMAIKVKPVPKPKARKKGAGSA